MEGLDRVPNVVAVEAGEVNDSVERALRRRGGDQADELLALLHAIALEQPHAAIAGEGVGGDATVAHGDAVTAGQQLLDHQAPHELRTPEHQDIARRQCSAGGRPAGPVRCRCCLHPGRAPPLLPAGEVGVDPRLARLGLFWSGVVRGLPSKSETLGLQGSQHADRCVCDKSHCTFRSTEKSGQ